MGGNSDGSLANDVLALARLSAGGPFPPTALVDLGGWTRLAAEAPSLAGSPTLPIVARLAARDAESGDADAVAALDAIVGAVLATNQPTLLKDSVDSLMASAVAAQVIGGKLAAGLEPIASAFLARPDRDAVPDLLAADAMEAFTRLVAAGHGSHFALLALLDKFRKPMVAPMARAVIRSVSTALDIWPAADPLVGVVRAVGGLDPVDGGDSTLAADVESDAAWVLAMAALLAALRASTLTAMSPHLQEAAKYFEIGATTHNRPDARPMLAIINALRELVAGIQASDPMTAMAGKPLSADELGGIRDQVHRLAVESSGFDHWFGDSKVATLRAWAQLAADLDEMRTQLGKDGFYQAEVVINDLLNVYVSSRTFRVAGRDSDIVAVQDLIQPVIEGGFASNASHLCNLEEYTAELTDAATMAGDEDLHQRLDAARSILKAARSVAKGGETPGKSDGGGPSAPLPPLIGTLVPPGSPDADLIGQISPTTLAVIEERLDHVAAARRHLNLVHTELFDDLRKHLATSPDYKDDVTPVVDEILILVINFVATRTGGQSNHYTYLFDPSAKEDAIHEDLFNYLVAALGDRAEYEVPHIGGGRVDVRLKFEKFALHIEMKVDNTQLPMHDRTAYLKQAATYQGNDVRIGFLIALRHKAFDPTGPPPHIKALITHTAMPIHGDPVPRHLVLVAMPGSRTIPSKSK
jgi:hypothetical protein